MKFIAAVAAILLLSIGLFINNLRPAPSVKARLAIGEKIVVTPQDYTNKTGAITVEYYARGHGPRIVLVASAGREVSDFNELVTTLNKNGYRTLAVEHPGIGKTTALKPDLNTYAFPIFTALQNDGYLKDNQPYFLMGHAFGNRVVRVTASYLTGKNARKPLLSGVILLAAGGYNEIDPKATEALKNAFNPLRPFKSRMRDVTYAFFANDNPVPPHWQRGWHTKTAIAQGKAKAGLETSGNTSWEAAGGVPMLVVQAAQDRIAPKNETADVLKARFPDQVEIAVIDNAGHALLPEQPEAIADVVIAFLARHRPANHNN